VKKAGTLKLNKERLRVLSSSSLRAAVGGDDSDWYDDGGFDFADGPNTMNVESRWRKYYADSVYYGGGDYNDSIYYGYVRGGGSGWYI